ncbi:MAG: 50S ribosomal protein L6 [Ignavibacteriales bacterium]|nr:50S ribosomal protein L6 [Ignavibacteriales bacterium]
MSRIGRKPVPIPKGVKIEISAKAITVAGAKGELTAALHPDVTVEVKGEEVLVTRHSDVKEHRSLHGLYRALIANMVKGVTDGFARKLELVGVGYRAEIKGKVLQLALGYSHPIIFRAPEGIKVEAPTQTSIMITGIDKQLVGLVAAKIRSFRPPEPYKGKGIKYEGEQIRRKAGKTAAAGGK